MTALLSDVNQIAKRRSDSPERSSRWIVPDTGRIAAAFIRHSHVIPSPWKNEKFHRSLLLIDYARFRND